MIACKNCHGSGIVWVHSSDIDPLTNIYRRYYRTSRGRQDRYYGNGGFMCDLGESVEWSFDCPRCKGAGTIEWGRGKCLTPLCRP